MANKIRLLSTSDVHGTIYPYSYADHSPQDYGLAKISTLVTALRDENTLLIDNGDILEGSPLTFYHYRQKAQEISPPTIALKDIGYDYVNLGNHDFNHGEEALLRHLDNCGAQCLCANVLYKGQFLGPEYVVHELCSKKIALFGITSHYVPHWENPDNITDMTFIDAYTCAENLVRKIKDEADPDYIICIYHGGFEKDPVSGMPSEKDTGENQGYRIAENLQDIDILIAGHQHRICSGKLFNTTYSQPGTNGAYLSCFEIDTDKDQIEVNLYRAEYNADQKIMDHCRQEEDEVQAWLDVPLGSTSMDLLVNDELDARLHKSQLATFINIAQSYVSGADLSATALSYQATGLPKEITMRSVVTTYIFSNTLTVKKINGKILKQYLEKCAEFWDISDGKIVIDSRYSTPFPLYHNYDMVDGIKYVIKVSNPCGSRIISMTKDGRQIAEDDEFTIVVNSYRAGGSGGFEMIRDAETIKEIQLNMMEILADYIEETGVIDFDEIHNIQVII